MNRPEAISPCEPFCGLILVGTKNSHKAAELGALMASLNSPRLKVTGLAQWEKEYFPLDEPVEGADGFVENAVLKARYYAAASGLPTMADDSGLSVSALNGAPGVMSARYGGPGLSDDERCDKLLAELNGVHDRLAFFTSVLALARPDGLALAWLGRIHGLISRVKKGRDGFGYDPVFYYPPARRTLAEMTAKEKNAISHRAEAARKFKDDSFRVLKFLGL